MKEKVSAENRVREVRRKTRKKFGKNTPFTPLSSGFGKNSETQRFSVNVFNAIDV